MTNGHQSMHPLNLLVRFLLELSGLAASGYWGWVTVDGVFSYLAAIILPVLFATVWAVFRVPNDPGPAPVAVPGFLRLLIEIVFFSTAVGLLLHAQREALAVIMAGLLVLHYATTTPRLRWLLAHDNHHGSGNV